jgi:type VI secretion system ImpM family protein
MLRYKDNTRMTSFNHDLALTYPIDLVWGGKLPCMGDFVWSEERSVQRTALDHWLLTGMQQFKTTLGDSWQTCFDLAPMWNFIVPSNTLGPGLITGCISPSCDRIGRRYPFAVAYSIAADAPNWYLSEVLHEAPILLTRTGVLLLNGIRRQWPRENLITLIKEALASWIDTLEFPANQTKTTKLAEKKLSSNTQTTSSTILSVLAGDYNADDTTVQNHSHNHKECLGESSQTNIDDDYDDDDAVTVPNNRYSSLPWHDAIRSLLAHSPTSFWWTNGAGGASLKAFTYGSHLDGSLMTWMFGRHAL